MDPTSEDYFNAFSWLIWCLASLPPESHFFTSITTLFTIRKAFLMVNQDLLYRELITSKYLFSDLMDVNQISMLKIITLIWAVCSVLFLHILLTRVNSCCNCGDICEVMYDTRVCGVLEMQYKMPKKFKTEIDAVNSMYSKLCNLPIGLMKPSLKAVSKCVRECW